MKNTKVYDKNIYKCMKNITNIKIREVETLVLEAYNMSKKSEI